MKGTIFLFFVCCAGLVASAQIGSKIQQQSKIAGVWQNNQFGYQMTLMLNPDGTGEFDGDAIRYTAKDGRLSLTIMAQSQTTVYNYVMNANMLTVSGGDLEQPVAFTKAGTTSTVSAAPVAAGAAIATPGPITTTSAGAATTTAATPAATSSVAQPAQPNSPATVAAPADQGLIGKWSGNNEAMEFRSDGKCIYNGTPIDYQVSQGHLMLNTQQGTAMMAYSISGNLLKMTINGAQYTYTRVEESRQGSALKGSRSAAAASKNVPAELAGKWCKMSTGTGYSSSACIVLNANGTYTYNSESSRSVNTQSLSGGTASQGADQGTWWVEGDRIYYNSATQGQGSYRLEKRNHPRNVNDPMIVLDGEAYVTATLKQPWR